MKRKSALLGALLLGGAGTGNAATIVLDGHSFAETGGVLGIAQQVTPQKISGVVWSTGALGYTVDWIEFHVLPPPSVSTSVVVDVLNNPGTNKATYPSELFRITSGTPTGPVVLAAQAASNTSVSVTLTAGVEYFLEMTSKTPRILGQSDQTLEVPRATTPLPAGLALFGSVFGLAGLLIRRRRAA
jgi:hypothetical protein